MECNSSTTLLFFLLIFLKASNALDNLPSCSVTFQFQHNVCGRSIYADGTVDVVLFLARTSAHRDGCVLCYIEDGYS